MLTKKRKDLTILSLLFVFCCLLTAGAARAFTKLPPAASAIALRPPFVKAWEFQSRETVDCTLPLGRNRIAFGTIGSYGVLDTRTGQLLWEKSVDKAIGGTSVAVVGGVSLAFDGKQLFALLEAGKIDACDPVDGHTLWQIPKTGCSSPMCVQQGKLLTSLREGKISAIDTATHRVVWTCKTFPESVRASSREYVHRLELAVEPTHNVAVVCQGNGMTAVDTASGNVLWRHSFPSSVDESDAYRNRAIAVDPAHAFSLDTNGNIEALWLASGTTAWRRHEPDSVGYFQSVAIHSGFLVSVTSSGSVRGYSVDSGSRQWSLPLSAAEMGYVAPPVFDDDKRVVVVNERSVIAVGATTGKRLWSLDMDHDPLTSAACYAMEDQLIVASGSGLICFRHGTPARLPSSHAARVKLARSLAAKLADFPSSRSPYVPEVRDSERELLKLGDDAFDALLPFLESSANEVAGSLFTLDYDSIFGHIYALISQVMRPESKTQGEAILRVARKYAHLADHYGVYSPLICLLADHGHSDLVVSALIARVNRIKSGTSINEVPPELTCLCNSSNPLAVKYLVSSLNNPETPVEVRSAAYLGLARSDSDAGVAAVLSMRSQPLAPLPSFRSLMDLDHLTTDIGVPHGNGKVKLLAIRTDESGNVWGLLNSGVIGSFGDLWIVPRTGDSWGDPIFTGVDTTEERAFFRGDDRKAFSLDGMTLAQLVDSGKWVEKFVHNPDLLKDSDRDGWTDLVEQRLGTDPMHASTDGSGVKDSLNRNPLGSRAPKGDAEEVLAAAFDARTRFRYDNVIAPFAVTFPKGIAPFRLRGYPALIVGKSESGNTKTNLEMRYGEFVGIVGFAEPQDGFDPRHGRRPESSGDPIRWNATRTEAIVGIGVAFGPMYGESYDIRLRKIRGHWFAIGAKLISVS